jgi:hypothetical protein
MQWPEEKAQNDKQWSTKQYTENQTSTNKNLTKNRQLSHFVVTKISQEFRLKNECKAIGYYSLI